MVKDERTRFQKFMDKMNEPVPLVYNSPEEYAQWVKVKNMGRQVQSQSQPDIHLHQHNTKIIIKNEKAAKAVFDKLEKQGIIELKEEEE